MPNDRFYRIDTALLTPSVNVATWSLTVKGMVDREVTLTYADLAELPLFEQYVTIACVSNEVGGNLVGNAKWTGVKLREVLDMAGVQAGATQLVGRSVDGGTAGMPTEWVMNAEREPMIALKMNDELLPKIHGFPARLIVPGLYGYVSATKWLAELELTTLEAFDGYWVPLGWSKEGPILTQSRIDVPSSGQQVPAGRVAIAGVAWAPDRGVSKVEVAIDGQWQECKLSTPISKATWVQWLYAWDTTNVPLGAHTIEVRATDGTGNVQTDQVTPPAPDGARGQTDHRHGRRLTAGIHGRESPHAPTDVLLPVPDRFDAGTVGEPGHGRSSSRPARPARSSASCSRRSRSRSSPSAWTSSSTSSRITASLRPRQTPRRPIPGRWTSR